MSKIKDRLLNRLVRTDVALRERVEKLREDQEAGLEQATWTAIVAVGSRARDRDHRPRHRVRDRLPRQAPRLRRES